MSVLNTKNAAPRKSGKYCECKTPHTRKPIELHLLMFTLVFVVCCLYALFQMTNSRYVTITINSASVSKGQNPDGSAFDIYEILGDEVLGAASKKLGGKITAAELKHHLSVSDALTAETNRQLKQSILDGEHENTHFPTVYCLTYATVPDKISTDGLGNQIRAFFRGSARSVDRILEAVAESYQEVYAASNLTYDSMFEIDWDSIESMDYYNRAEALRTEAMRILRFLQDKADENPVAESSSEELTYGDLSNDLRQLICVDIENHQAYIIQNSITKSRKELLRQFRYMEELYKEEKERKTEEYLILDEAVDMYDSTTTKVVFIPALDQDDSFYMNRTKVGLDYLVESADAARLAADEAEHNAKYYLYLQSCFAETATLKQSQIAHTDAIYQNIRGELEELIESVKLLLAECNQTENEGIKVSDARMSAGIAGIGMSFAKRFVILSMAAYVLLCIPSVFPKKKMEESQEV